MSAYNDLYLLYKILWIENHIVILFQSCMYLCECEKAWLHCQQFKLLRIKRVYWGQDNEKMCPKIPPGLTGDGCDADEEKAFDKIEQQCRHDQACEVVSSNVLFDDNTYKNTYKFLKICYDCIR